MNQWENRLLLVSTESVTETQPHPPIAFSTIYLSSVLSAYAQRHQTAMVRSIPIQQGLNLESLWNDLNQGSSQSSEKPSDWMLLPCLESLASPLTADTIVADLAWDWRLATVLVVPLRPNAINQTIAYVSLARQSRCHLKGVLFCAVDQPSWNDREILVHSSLIQSFIQLPILGTLPPWEPDASISQLAKLGANLKLEYFFPCRIDPRLLIELDPTP